MAGATGELGKVGVDGGFADEMRRFLPSPVVRKTVERPRRAAAVALEASEAYEKVAIGPVRPQDERGETVR